MEQTQSLPPKSKISYALGAVGKDMVYMLSASYVLYYFQDILGVSAAAMGVILMVARVFDAFNDKGYNIRIVFSDYSKKKLFIYY